MNYLGAYTRIKRVTKQQVSELQNRALLLPSV